MKVYVKYVILISSSCFVDGQGLYWGFFVHAHDFTVATTKDGMRPAWVSDERIKSHLQAFNIALSGLLLVFLDSYDFSRQSWELHLEVRCRDNGFELI